MKIEDSAVHVRDTKQHDGPILIFTHQEWADFVAGVKLDEFSPGEGTSASAE